MSSDTRKQIAANSVHYVEEEANKHTQLFSIVVFELFFVFFTTLMHFIEAADGYGAFWDVEHLQLFFFRRPPHNRDYRHELVKCVKFQG